MYDAESEVKELLDSLSDEELIHLLQESGFEVNKGNGEVIYTGDSDIKNVNVVSGKVTIKFNPDNPTSPKSTRIKSFPSAC